MNIDLTKIDKEKFNVKEGAIAGDVVYLIYPKKSDGQDIWTKDNLHLRSLIVTQEGEVISHGWPKFFNLGQNPALYPDPTQFNDWVIQEKMDGSAIFISKYKGELIIRTRQTMDYQSQPNAQELTDLLKEEKYQIFLKDLKEGGTILMEWLSPTNRIVLFYEKPELICLGWIDHENGQIVSDKRSLTFVESYYGIRIPKFYTFNSIEDIVENCKTLIGMEGYVVSYNGGQNKVKAKGDEYCIKHRMKENFQNFWHIFDFWIAEGKPTNTFARIEESIDWETANASEKFIDEINRIYAIYNEKLVEITKFVKTTDSLDQATFARLVLERYAKDGPYKALAFSVRAGKIISDVQLRKYFEFEKNQPQN